IEINHAIDLIMQHSFATETIAYKNVIVNYLTQTNARMECAKSLREKWNNQNVNAFNASNSALAEVQKALTGEMLKAFDQVGITYQVKDKNVLYQVR
ncbi:MAG: hypothetical protein H7Y41_04465, partial [Hyphomonadaceae bacterium]|nr:hypothetical protein [Clostridia bacterium]